MTLETPEQLTNRSYTLPERKHLLMLKKTSVHKLHLIRQIKNISIMPLSVWYSITVLVNIWCNVYLHPLCLQQYIFEVNLSYLKQCFITLVKWFVVQFADQLSYSWNRKANNFPINKAPRRRHHNKVATIAGFQWDNQQRNKEQHLVQIPYWLTIHLKLFF